MPQKTTDFFISVGAGANADGEELDELARQLAGELAELDMVSAELGQTGDLPERAKVAPVTIGTILVKVAEAGGITGLITALGSWLSCDERRTVTVQIGENRLEVTGISKAEQTNLIQWFQTQTGLRLEGVYAIGDVNWMPATAEDHALADEVHEGHQPPSPPSVIYLIEPQMRPF